MTENTTNGPSYTTLQSIGDRKAQLLKEIRKDSNQISKLRRDLFAKPTLPAKKSGFMPSNLVNKGASVLDGLLLVWKLYRKFHRK